MPFCFYAKFGRDHYGALGLLIALDSFVFDVNIRVITYLFFILFSSSRVLCFAFLSRIYIAVASLLNGMIDILLDFHVMRPLEFLIFHKSLILLLQRPMYGHLTI